MVIYLCYGCDTYLDSDEGCYESMLAKLRETGAHKFENVCEECHESEMDELSSKEGA